MFQFLLTNLLFFNFFLIIGYLICQQFGNIFIIKSFSTFWGKNFLQLLVGIFTVISLYAIIRTSGISVFSLAIIPVLFLLIIGKNKFQLAKINFREIGFIKVNILLMLFFLVMYFSSMLDGKIRTEFHPDLHYYENISFYLNQGYENCFSDLNEIYLKKSIVRDPYHYFELWLAAFIGFLTQQKSYIYILQFIVIPILLTITTAGFLAIWERYNKLNSWNYIVFGVLALFVGSICIFLNEPILNFLDHYFTNQTIVLENRYHFNYFLLVKNLPFYILSTLVVLLFIENQLTKALIVLCLGIILNVGLIPGISFAIFSYSLFLLWRKSILSSEWLKINLCLLLVCAGFVMFYSSFSISNSESIFNKNMLPPLPIYSFLSHLSIKGEVIRAIYRFLGPFLYLTILYFFYIGFIAAFKNKFFPKLKQILFFVFLLLIGGLLTRLVLTGMNSPQFLSYLLPFINVVLILFFAHHFSKHKKIIFTILIIGLISNYAQINVFINQNDGKPGEQLYSYNFQKKVEKELSKNVSAKVGWIMSEKEQLKTSKILWMYSAPCLFINTIGIHQYYNLNDPFLDTNKDKKEIGHTDQLKYYTKDSTSLNYEQNLSSFIQKKRIDFVLIKSDVNLINYKFLNLIFLVNDPTSGVSLYKTSN